ncbi:hypothetical protein [Nitrosomonas sp.]|uniref:hypothetical protein n=1 Tax=Nitrosomonas sp. TaxID=42353 RepID=UPI0020809658|nr:hypothetical protein [Nitrosomonas sp.]GJL76898.1 MAG: hypothetical protein NMNS02_30040 [Nitrosomonas sp.]
MTLKLQSSSAAQGRAVSGRMSPRGFQKSVDTSLGPSDYLPIDWQQMSVPTTSEEYGIVIHDY